MPSDFITEVKPKKQLIMLASLANGVIGTSLGIVLIESLNKESLFSFYNGIIFVLVCMPFFIIITFFQLKSGVFDYLSVSISDKEITGFSGEPFTKKRVTFLLTEIDIEKTNNPPVTLHSILDRFWRGSRKYIWSIHGQRIIIVKSVFSKEQVKFLFEKTGCII